MSDNRKVVAFGMHESKKKYALKNYKDIISWYQLPWRKRVFSKCPVKELIEIK